MNVPRRWKGSVSGLVPVLALVAVGASCEVRGDSPARPAPLFKGATIPDPPRQHDPWTPPETSVPRFMTRAAATLFDQGLADPRGCDYRAIEITIGGVWSNTGHVLATHGWVLPEAKGEPTRFAVAWNGLVYPAVSVSGPADLEADVRALEEAASALGKSRRRRSDRTLSGAFFAYNRNDEGGPVGLKMLHPIEVCLLLRAGHAELAERVWAAGTGIPRVRGRAPKVDLSQYGVSYLTMANDLAWYHFDRAIGAHMRGDDAVALADARMLTAFRAAAEAKADAMGFARPRDLSNRREEPMPYIGFLDQLPDLLADHERRAREPKRSPVPPPGTDKKARIAALIADLDQVFARQFGQPGGVSLGECPTVQALIAEGDDAVELLLGDLERDVRLTRSVHFFRDFHRSRTIMGAHEAAYTALVGLLKTSFFGPRTTGGNLTNRGLEGRIVVANQIRAYWEKNRGVPLADRWYRTLADDVGGSSGWLQAAGNIVRHENVSVIPGSTAFGSVLTTTLPKGTQPKLRGEALRDRKDPSISELMAQRVRDLDPGDPIDPRTRNASGVTAANQMARMLAEWDPKAALPVLKARVKRCASVVQAGQKANQRYYGMETTIAEMTELRAKLGDQQALADYAEWVRTVTPDHFDFLPISMFAPLWRNPDHPALKAAAAALFAAPKSPWNPPVWRGEPTVPEGHRRELFSTPLLGLESFRTLVLRALADRTEVGTIEVDATGRVVVIQGNYRTTYSEERVVSSGEFSGDPDDKSRPFQPGAGAMPLRMADKACEKLEQLEGIPRFQKQWSLDRRDRAIAATVAYLKKYGERFRENEASRRIRASEPGSDNHPAALLAFDPLDHPATRADAAEGRAIFSLEGPGAEVRRVAMPAFPLEARWTKLEVFRDDPPVTRVYDSEGHEKSNTEALQAGRVWQAEEVREGDRWRRYYGFAGRHALARVPADEIEFTTPWREGWQLLSADLDGRIRIDDGTASGPLPFEVDIRNHHGVDAFAPTNLVRGADDAASVREGIAFRLVRESDRPEYVFPFQVQEHAATEPFAEQEIAPLVLRKHPSANATQTLAPAATATVMKLDLRKLFAVTQLGRYRLEIEFADMKLPGGKAGHLTHMFLVRPTASP